MPLINYKIGDELKIDEDKNINYIYNGQLINQVIGRSSDILFFENGKAITGPGFTVLFKDIPVDYYCVEKTSGNSIVCWIIKLPAYTKDHQQLIFQTIKKQVGENVSVDIRYTDKPFLSNSGKRQYFIDQN
jgi:phenylacetate-CoA ligase